MRAHSLLAAFVALLAVQAIAQDAPPPSANRSLMFTPEEVAHITGAIADVNRPRVETRVDDETGPAKPVLPNIYVSAVADYGAGQWTVWANGMRISPGRKAPGFQVVGVKDDRVEILVEADSPMRILLRPHQTWLAASNNVVEGIVP